MEEFINGDAGVFEFDLGVFEAVVEVWFATGGQDDVADADELFGAFVAENEVGAVFVVTDGNDLAVS